MSSLRFDKSQLRNIAVRAQYLDRYIGSGISGTEKAINHLGYIQIDALSVVERAHHHTLWNRVRSYEKGNLNTLLKKKNIFEYWYHAASYLPIDDYRYSLFRKESVRSGSVKYLASVDSKRTRDVYRNIESEGPLRLRDLQNRNTRTNSWWQVGAVKMAVEKLVMQGDLVVTERHGNEKIYEITSRWLPQGVNQTIPTSAELAVYHLRNVARSNGVFTWRQYVHPVKGKELLDTFKDCLMDAVDRQVIFSTSDSAGNSFYVANQYIDRKFQVKNRVKILSPFDNLIIHRDRLKSLFDTIYKLECYTPKEKRQFGYFVLPVLHGTRIVGGIDCKVDRSARRFKIVGLNLNSKDYEAEYKKEINESIEEYAKFNGCLSFDVI